MRQLLFVLQLLVVCSIFNTATVKGGFVVLPLGPTNTSVPENYFQGSDGDTRCRICEIDCLPTGLKLFLTCKYRYFHYGCRDKSYCLKAESYNLQQSFAAALVCATFNECEFNIPSTDPRNLVQRLNVYQLYVEKYKLYGLDINLDDLCNPNYGTDTTNAKCVQAKFAENYVKYDEYVQQQLKDYFTNLKGYNTDLTEMKRRAFVTLGVPPAFFYYFKILQDFKDGFINSNYEKMVKEGLNKYRNFYASVRQEPPYSMYFDQAKFADAMKKQLTEDPKSPKYRLDRIWSLVEVYVADKLNAKREIEGIETQLATLGVSANNVAVDSSLTYKLSEAPSAGGFGGGGNFRSYMAAPSVAGTAEKFSGSSVTPTATPVIPKDNTKEINDLKTKRTALMKTYYIDLDAKLVKDYKAMWELWTTIQVNRYFVDVVVFGVPGVRNHFTLDQGIECPASSSLFAQDDKGGLCCVGSLAEYDGKANIYRKCLGEIVCAITANNRGFVGCKGVTVSKEIIAKYPGKIEWPVLAAPLQLPQDVDTSITVDQWYLSKGNKYRGLDSEPSKEIIEKVSGPLAWSKHNSQSLRIDVGGVECLWKEAVGMYGVGYVWFPERGAIIARVSTDDVSWLFINDQLIFSDKCCGSRDRDISKHVALKRGAWNKVYAVGAEGCLNGFLGVEFLLEPYYPKLSKPTSLPVDAVTSFAYSGVHISTGPIYSGLNHEPSKKEIEDLSAPKTWSRVDVQNNQISVTANAGSCNWRSLSGMYIYGYIWVPYSGSIHVKITTDDVSYLSLNGNSVLKDPCCGEKSHDITMAVTRGAWNKLYVVGADGCGAGTVILKFSVAQIPALPSNVNIVGFAEWFTAIGVTYRGLGREPANVNELQTLSRPPAWSKTTGNKIYLEQKGQRCGHQDLVGIFAVGYVFIPAQGNVFLNLNTDDKSWVYVNDNLVKTDGCCGLKKHDITKEPSLKRGQWNKVFAADAEYCATGFLGIEFTQQ